MTETQLQSTGASTRSDARWAGVGTSTLDNSYEAGVRAASDADAGGDAALFVVFAGHRHDHEALLAGVASVASNDASVVGCSTGGEIGVAGPTDDGVVVMALGGDGISFASRCADVVGGDLRTAGELAADAVWDVEDRGHTVLLMLSDGLAGDQQEVVRGAYATTGATIPLVGGCAGDGMEMAQATLFHANKNGSRIGGNQVIGVAISSVAPIGIGVSHGWEAVGESVLITKSVGNVVHEIDGEPALDRYLRLHGAPADLASDPNAFTQFASTHPIGLAHRGRDEVRFISSADPEARTITSIAGVPQGVVAHAMAGTVESVLDATDSACDAALAQIGSQPVAVLAFDCVARRGVMGEDGPAVEIDRIQRRVGAPIAGFYTYGEFARVTGASGFHNQTLVTLAIG
ncbi:MAG: FIST N-terminal domain-containing protein [Acidimicrobiales bacterium]|nr:FIST N-terminal domain-containing protein [Acidimicrobiales bacterium]